MPYEVRFLRGRDGPQITYRRYVIPCPPEEPPTYIGQQGASCGARSVLYVWTDACERFGGWGNRGPFDPRAGFEDVSLLCGPLASDLGREKRSRR